MDWKIKYFNDDILPKLIYRSDVSTIHILIRLQYLYVLRKGRSSQVDSKIYRKYQELRRAKIFLKKKTEKEECDLPDIKIYHKLE